MTVLLNQQLEQTIKESIQALYISKLGRQPEEISSHIDNSRLTIFLESGITCPEQFLLAHGRTALVEEVREALHEILRPQVKTLIEQLTGAAVADVGITANLNLGYVSFVIALTQPLEGQPAKAEP